MFIKNGWSFNHGIAFLPANSSSLQGSESGTADTWRRSCASTRGFTEELTGALRCATPGVNPRRSSSPTGLVDFLPGVTAATVFFLKKKTKLYLLFEQIQGCIYFKNNPWWFLKIWKKNRLFERASLITSFLMLLTEQNVSALHKHT